MAKLKEAEYIAETQSMRQLKKKYNLVIFDFGAPYVITPTGDNFIRVFTEQFQIYDEIFEGLKIEKGVFFVEYL